MNKITIHEALSELKIIEKKIVDSMGTNIVVSAAKLSAKKIDGMDLTEYQRKLQGNYDRVRAMYDRRNALRLAVVKSNSISMVTIAGVEMTVAQAIVRKGQIEDEVGLLRDIIIQYENALAKLRKENGEKLEDKLNTHLANTIGSNYKENTRLADVVAALTMEFHDNNAYGLIDPINVGKVIDKMREDTGKFLAQVDSAISVSNALTYIEV